MPGALLVVACLAAAGPDEAARQYNKEAIAAYRVHDYEAALVAFERAWELFPDPKVRLNMALANENLNRFDDAQLHYEAFLRQYPLHEKAPQVRRKLKELASNMRKWGKVVVTVTPEPDSVELAGRRFRRWPVKAWLEPGGYPLKVEKQGYHVHQETVVVDKGQRGEVRVSLEPLAATPATLPEPAPEPPAPVVTPAPAPAATPAPAPAEPAPSRAAAWLTRSAGALALVGAAGPLALAAASAGAVAAIYSVVWFVPGTDFYRVPLQAGVWVGAAAAGAGLLLGVVTVAAGLSAVVASLLL
ncbi:MAG: PEGA domain-containing protein [Deltaproteobacteria bacterium]|nr:PEGA domain-containing protein [Deltaproteobacteria bacterium]